MKKKIPSLFPVPLGPLHCDSIIHLKKGEFKSHNCEDHSFWRGTGPLLGAGASRGLRRASGMRAT